MNRKRIDKEEEQSEDEKTLEYLSVEILGIILRDAIGASLLTHFVVSCVCQQWRSLMPFKPSPRQQVLQYRRRRKLGITLASEAARCGSMKLLKWLIALGCPWENVIVCASAARGGHLKVLKWVRKRSCPWNALTCRKAARGGRKGEWMSMGV